jgi:hypothetical protein
MRPLSILLLATCTSILLPGAGWSEDAPYTVKGRTFNFPTPTGFCMPNSANSNEAEFVKTVQALMANSGNTVVKVAAECSQIRRRGADRSRRISDYIVYYYVNGTENESLEGSAQSHRKDLCDDMRQQGDASVADVPDIVAKTAKELNSKLTVSGVKVLGVLAEDAHGCYVGLLANTRDNAGPFTMNVDMLATVIHGRSLFVALYSEYKNPSESQKSLRLEEAIAADLDSKNPD